MITLRNLLIGLLLVIGASSCTTLVPSSDEYPVVRYYNVYPSYYRTAPYPRYRPAPTPPKPKPNTPSIRPNVGNKRHR